MRSTSPSCPATAVWAWRGQLVSGVFTFLFCKVKRLVVINIPHPSPRPFSLIPCLVFLGVVMCIIAHESVEKRPLHFQDICRCHWKTHAIPKRVLVVFFFFLTEWFMIYFTEVKIASPTDEWVLIEGKSCLRDVDLCLLFSLSRWKFWRHLVV